MAQQRNKSIKGFEFVRSVGEISEYRLKRNGLSVLIAPDHTAPVVNVMITYLVGSRNEALGHTGATHLLEHLLFKGSRRFSLKKFRDMIGARGAKWNATTWLDRTNYFELVPKEYVEDALAIEADRMRGAILSDKEKSREMTVVRNEFERGENSPLEALDKAIWSAAFVAHPYHHPTIGWRSDIENVSAKQLRRFYDTFYWPDNAALSFVGDITEELALQLTVKHFGEIPKAPHQIPQVYTTEPPQEGERRVAVSRASETPILGMAYKIPPALHADTAALEILMQVLCGGKSSRLNIRLVDRGLAVDIQPLYMPHRDESLFLIYAVLTPTANHKRVEQVINNELAKIKKVGVTGKEISRGKAKIASALAWSRDGAETASGALNEAIALGDWTFYATFGEKAQNVTTDDVRQAAQKYLVTDKSTVGWFVPKK